MTYQTLCELFLLTLLAISCARIFFIQIGKQDALSVVPVIVFFLSLLNLLAFGFSVFGLLITVLSLFITIWNANALSRFNHQLVVDHYGVLFSIFSIINLILAITLGVFIFLYRPAKISTKKYSVNITTATYSGDSEAGFTEYKSPLKKKTAVIKKYEQKNAELKFKEQRTIVFVPGELTKTDFYEPFFVKLAHDGYTVYSADINTDDIKWFNNAFDFPPLKDFIMRYTKIKKPETYAAATNQKTENFVKQVIAALDIIAPSTQDNLFIVGDGEIIAAYTAAKLAKQNFIDGTFDLSSIKSYTTPGYGPVDSTEPFIANYLGQKRDPSFYMSSHIAGILEKSIEEVLNPPAKPVEPIPETAEPEISSEENLVTEQE